MFGNMITQIKLIMLNSVYGYSYTVYYNNKYTNLPIYIFWKKVYGNVL